MIHIHIYNHIIFRYRHDRILDQHHNHHDRGLFIVYVLLLSPLLFSWLLLLLLLFTCNQYFAGRHLLCLSIAIPLRYHPVALYLLPPMDWVLFLLIPSTSIPLPPLPLPLIDLFLYRKPSCCCCL